MDNTEDLPKDKQIEYHLRLMQEIKIKRNMVLAKILLIIDPSLGEFFLNEVKTNWDNTTPTQMTLDRLQRLVQSVVTSKEKFKWL